ncbi:MAG: T9SS type A sorting domain-containing protein [Bacteroidota bacterium]|nr:T9SS type A sorting domain-containing protein [Bacteroidota bacterium]
MKRKIFFLNLFLIPISGLIYAQTWLQLPATGNPMQRSNASAIYEQAGNRVIVFGGKTSSGNLNDVWSLNLNNYEWQNITPVSGQMPSPRFSQNAVYDSLMNRMIIWSGQGAELYNDVWAFNLSNNSWQELWQDGNVPGAPLKRYGTAAVFDPVNRRLVNFAGFTTSGRFEDTWYFQIDSMMWTDRTNSFHPELRCLHSAHITSHRTQMIIYGGQHNGALGDIWSLNLNSFEWTNITPAVKPESRWFSPVICTNSNEAFIYGGQNSQTILGDLWKFNLTNNSWDSITQGTIRPGARYGHIAVYVPVSNKMIIFGGSDPSYKNDTWIFNIGTVGISNISSSVPDGYTLYQNFPNPFNPVTRIKFDIPADISKINVKLIVYDISGKEIEILVDEKLNAGSYEVQFNGANLSSGVYFYKITNGNYADTKKMFLLK